MTPAILDAMLPRELRTGDPDLRRRARVIAAFGLVVVVTLVVLTIGAVVVGLWVNAVGTLLGILAAGGLLFALRRGVSIQVLGAAVGLFVMLIAVQGAVSLGGFGSPPANWLAVVPLLVLLVTGARIGTAFVVLVVVVQTALFLSRGASVPIAPAIRYFDGIAMSSAVFMIALVYENFRRRAMVEIRDAHTRISELTQKLVDAAHTAGMADVATSVVHDAGNALNHVSTAASLAAEHLAGIQVQRLENVSRALVAPRQVDDQKLAAYVGELGMLLHRQRAAAADEMARLLEAVEHVSAVIASLQEHAGPTDHVTVVDLKRTLEDVLHLERSACTQKGIEIAETLAAVPPCMISKHRFLLVVTNLVRNAIAAVLEGGTRRIEIRLQRSEADHSVRLEVTDHGIGIAPEHVDQLFRHGFTTRVGGHGYGLHSSAIAAGELGGRLTFSSAGRGCGATFVFEMPFVPVRAG